MATVDYHQIAEDHQSFLVLIRHAGKQLSWKQFSRCWERVCHNTCVAVPGQKRDMWIRYRRSYSRDNNEWGDIQAHRKVLGLICIGKCTNENEFEELFQSYKHEKSQYSDTLFNSRLFVYGMNKDGTPLTEEQILQFDGAAGDQGQTPLTMKIDGNISDNKACDSLSNVNKENDNNVNGETKTSHSDPLRSNDTTSSTQVTKNTENKAKRTSNEPSVTIFKTETKPPPPPPVRTNSKPSQMNKDTPGSEVVFFPRVDNFEDELDDSVREFVTSLFFVLEGSEVVFFPRVDNFKDELDDSVREFVTSLFFVLEGKRLDRSFERADKQLLLCAPFEKKDYVGIDPDSKSYRKKCQGRLRKHLADLCLLAGLPGEAILHYTTAIDILKPVNDWLWMGGLAIQSKVLHILSEDDYCSPKECIRLMKRCYPPDKTDNCTVLAYDKAGHLLEPPYSALCRMSYHKSFDMYFMWGGFPEEHAKAQEHAWNSILSSFDQNIPKTSTNDSFKSNL